jgi:uncharacterized integral membrane protein
MIGKKKHWFATPEGEDERIVAGRRNAGNVSFLVVMVLLWIAMVIGLVINRMDITLVPFAVFMAGCVTYLAALARNGAFGTGTVRKPGRIRRVIAYATGGAVFGIIQFLLKAKDVGTGDVSGFVSAGVYALVSTIIWTLFFVGALRLLKRMSDRTIEKNL